MNVTLDNDISQEALVKFCKETEAFLREALKSIDRNSDCAIHTSLDLGFPHDLIRIAGGFATGSFVEWKCNIPFIPVDTTVNVCTGSIFEISNVDEIYFSENHFLAFKNKIEASTYNFNFHRGNHFIIFAQSEVSKKYYLLLHSSASEFKKDYNGLYPVKGNWYYNDMQTFLKGNRYLRFITGDKASLFAQIAKQILQYNEVRHEFAAATLLNDYAKVLECNHYHHYFMPDQASVMMGSYLAEVNEIVPIFTSVGLPLYLYRVGENTNNQVKFRGETKYLVPHGWGKKSNLKPAIEVDYINNTFTLNEKMQPIEIESSLRDHPDLCTRTFSINSADDDYYFKKIENKISGVVTDKLIQLSSFTKHGYRKWTE